MKKTLLWIEPSVTIPSVVLQLLLWVVVLFMVTIPTPETTTIKIVLLVQLIPVGVATLLKNLTSRCVYLVACMCNLSATCVTLYLLPTGQIQNQTDVMLLVWLYTSFITEALRYPSRSELQEAVWDTASERGLSFCTQIYHKYIYYNPNTKTIFMRLCFFIISCGVWIYRYHTLSFDLPRLLNQILVNSIVEIAIVNFAWQPSIAPNPEKCDERPSLGELMVVNTMKDRSFNSDDFSRCSFSCSKTQAPTKNRISRSVSLDHHELKKMVFDYSRHKTMNRLTTTIINEYSESSEPSSPKSFIPCPM